MADLVVELYGMRIGALVGSWRTFDFLPSTAAVSAFGIDSPLLSVAVPLALVPTRSRKGQRQNFFRELLPEGRMLTRMAQEAGVPAHDSIGMLRAYGRDVAGALQIWDPDVPGEPRQPALEHLSRPQVARMLMQVQDNPLGNRRVGGKTSLAGVQDKIVLAREADGWSRVVDGFPSTHILKPESKDQQSMIYDEEYGARLVRALHLADFQTWIEKFDGMPALIIERYDRSVHAPQGRVHQEDLNQALGASGNEKYQRYGGRTSLSRIADVLREFADDDSCERLLRMLVLAVAIGNLDMHGKNFALIHELGDNIKLAPAYDFVPQTHQPNDGEMALAVAGEHCHEAITRAHLVEEALTWGITEPERVIDDSLATVLDVVAHEVPHPLAHKGLRPEITRFTENLLAGKRAGAL